MKAIVRRGYGSPDELEILDIERPKPGPDDVLVKVMAFGVNRAEIYMRRGQWGDVAAVSGIECVGTVSEDPSGKLAKGQTVAAVMGGMGRTINGSYAEYVSVPAANVVALETNLDWPELAAIPESYATAWACLHGNLRIGACTSLMVRGGTSALGQAAINIAADQGIHVMASTRDPERFGFLGAIGAADTLAEAPDLSSRVREQHPAGVDAVLDIVGNTTLMDSLKMPRKAGYVCNAGFLGGGDPVALNPLTDMPSAVNLNFFASFMFGTPDFPLSDIPLQEIADKAASSAYKCMPAHVFPFNEIMEAHELMESNRACGKIVISV